MAADLLLWVLDANKMQIISKTKYWLFYEVKINMFEPKVVIQKPYLRERGTPPQICLKFILRKSQEVTGSYYVF